MPGSPVYSIASTAAHAVSHFSLPQPPAPRSAHAVLRKADLEHSQDAYADLVASAKTYRLALASLSTAASAFGSALEACARLKEARAEPIGPAGVTASFAATSRAACTADPLLAASGVHHLVANHQQILSETVYRSFEVPLLHDLDRWRSVIEDEEVTYQHKIRAQSREVKRLEKEGLKLHKQPRRDVARFRAHLVHLTNKLDGLTTLHADHARTLLRESQDTSARIVDASCSLVRAEVDIFESLARKGWTGGGLDDLLERGHDLFASDDAGGAGANAADPAKLFSVLPPKSILADSASDTSRLDHDRADGLLPADDGHGFHSFSAPATASTASDVTDASSSNSSAGTITASAAAAASTPISAIGSVPSSLDSNKPRPPRPFSPQPIRRIPTDVTFESLGALGALGAAEPPATARGEWRSRLADDAEEMEEDDGSCKAADGGGPGPEQPQQQSGATEMEAQQGRGRRRSQSPGPDRRSSSPGLAPTGTDEAEGS